MPDESPASSSNSSGRSYEIPPGLHWWCTCGLTGHPPFCDGSHKGSGRQPLRFQRRETTRATWSRQLPTGDPPADD